MAKVATNMARCLRVKHVLITLNTCTKNHAALSHKSSGLTLSVKTNIFLALSQIHLKSQVTDYLKLSVHSTLMERMFAFGQCMKWQGSQVVFLPALMMECCSWNEPGPLIHLWFYTQVQWKLAIMGKMGQFRCLDTSKRRTPPRRVHLCSCNSTGQQWSPSCFWSVCSVVCHYWRMKLRINYLPTTEATIIVCTMNE